MIPEINLLPKYERQNIVLYRLFMIGLVVVLLTFIGLTYVYFQTKSNISKVEEQNEQLIEQQALLEAQLANAGSNKPESLEAVVSFAEEYLVPTSMLIEEFNNLLPRNAYITTYDYVFGTVGIESQFETKNDVSIYITSLLDSDYMNDVKVDRVETREFELAEDAMISRQIVNYSLDINLAKLKEEAKQHE